MIEIVYNASAVLVGRRLETDVLLISLSVSFLCARNVFILSRGLVRRDIGLFLELVPHTLMAERLQRDKPLNLECLGFLPRAFHGSHVERDFRTVHIL